MAPPHGQYIYCIFGFRCFALSCVALCVQLSTSVAQLVEHLPGMHFSLKMTILGCIACGGSHCLNTSCTYSIGVMYSEEMLFTH